MDVKKGLGREGKERTGKEGRKEMGGVQQIIITDWNSYVLIPSSVGKVLWNTIKLKCVSMLIH